LSTILDLFNNYYHNSNNMLHRCNPFFCHHVPRNTVALTRVIASVSETSPKSFSTESVTAAVAANTTTRCAVLGNNNVARETIRHSSSTLLFVLQQERRSFSSSSSETKEKTNITTGRGRISDYLGSLRLKAANALASTMPEQERNQLLERLGIATTTTMNPLSGNNDETAKGDEEEDAVLEYQHSIDEAVAAAKAKEAAMYAERWEREKDQLLAGAEAAARRRVQSDLEIQRRAIAFEAWKQNLEREKNAEKIAADAEVSATSVAPATAAVTVPASEVSATQTMEDELKTSTDENYVLGEHPILGPVLADLGYKRIHLTSSRALAAIPVWKKQRIYRHGRAKSMASDKMKTLHLGLPGVIGIFEVRKND
jgi:hypothetical protein